MVPLQPPSGFSDGQELSEAECDREAASGPDNVALPLFRHEELEQELSTLVKRFVVMSEANCYMLWNTEHEVICVYCYELHFSLLSMTGTLIVLFCFIRHGKGFS